MSQLIAITGKGGTGKTTLAACLTRALIDNGLRPVLAVDADPNATLAPLLGLLLTPTISDIRQEMLEAKTDITAISKDRLLEMKLEDCLQESTGFDLLTMGRPEGPSCYCYVNNLLRAALGRLKKNYQTLIIDNEAGMEHLSRMNTADIDSLTFVSQPTLTSARSVANIIKLADSLPVKVHRYALIWNMVDPQGVPDKAREAIDPERFAKIVEIERDEKLAHFAAFEESVFDSPPMPEISEKLLAAVGYGQ